MTYTRSHTFIGTLVVLAVCGMSMLVSTPAHAATNDTAISPNLYAALKAKVVYLEAVLASLKAGGTLDVAPTFATWLSAHTVTVSGTLSRPGNADMVEICGPMQKGMIEWGDGESTDVMGLGCSGDVTEFELSHEYAATGSYSVTLHDLEERSLTRNVSVIVP